MNCLSNISCIVLVIIPLVATTPCLPSSTIEISYENSIDQSAQEWTDRYITQSSNHEIQTIIDLLLLSYQTITASCTMIIAKFTIQQELFKIYTPSFIDSWHEHLQINQNDTRKLEEALVIIKNSQNSLQEVYEKFQKLLPFILKMNPQPTQTLILDLKSSLLVWGKHQQLLTNQLLEVQNEFAHATATISDVKTLFDTISQSSEVKHTYLKEAASFFSRTYKEIDTSIDHLAHIRIEGILKIQRFFEYFFKTYYATMYQKLTIEQKQALLTMAKNPYPDVFFA